MRRFTAALGVTTALVIATVGLSQAATGTWDRAWGGGVICTTAASCLAYPSGGQGGRMTGAKAVATDAAGNVYVAEREGHRIQKFDSLGNFQSAWGKNVNGGGVFGVCTVAASCQVGTTGGLGGEMNNPEGIAVDTAGNVYVADRGNNRVQKFSSTGVWERTWGGNVNGEGEVLEVCTVAASCLTGGDGTFGPLREFPVPQNVATDPAGKVYVISGDAIVKFTPLGGFERTWGRGVSGSGIGGGFGVFEICTTSAEACYDGISGPLGGEMNSPRGIAVDASGDVNVADDNNNRIQQFDSSGNFLRAWGKDVASAGMGHTGNGFEICVAADGDTCKAGTTGGLGGEMFAPFGVAADSDDNVYVSEQGNHRIQKFDSVGTWDRAWGRSVGGGGAVFGTCTAAASCLAGTQGPKGGEMSFPSGLATDSADNLYVGDAGNGRFQKFGSAVVVPPPGGGGGGGGGGAAPAGPTGQRAAALKKCKKKKGKARANCKKKAKKLPL